MEEAYQRKKQQDFYYKMGLVLEKIDASQNDP